MTWEAWLTVGVIVAMVGALYFRAYAADAIVVGCALVLIIAGVLTPEQALDAAANPGAATLALLYVVVAGLVETGAVRWVAGVVLGRARAGFEATTRLTLSTCGLSAFVNNTPLVAMFIPAVQGWCRQRGLPASKYMLPLSYAAILGGSFTLVGTSTNLVISGEWASAGRDPLGFFEIAALGGPLAVIGLVYLIFVAPRLLPERGAVLDADQDQSGYTVAMVVEAGSPLAGKTVERAGLRALSGVFLAEIERGGTDDRPGDVLPAVGPQEVLREGDRLVFVGRVDSVVDLQKMRGLAPATDQIVKINEPRPNRVLVEAAVSHRSDLVGRTVRQARFRSVYNAVVIAVARAGERLRGKIGDIEIRAGDTLLLEAPRGFIEQNRGRSDFYLVSEVKDSVAPRHERAIVALVVLAGMVGAVASGKVSMLVAAAVAGAAMVGAKCCGLWQVRKAIDWRVLTVVCGSLAIGEALDQSGAAAHLGSLLTDLTAGRPFLTLAVIYATTMLLTEMVTNNAAAILMFFVADAAAESLGVSFKPFVFSIMMAASASFSTPLGYQTNLMVLGPGGYRFGDYLRVGLPLNLLSMGVTLTLAPLVWPFEP
ncbi:MAG: SLC13 family permease [Planctomycetota bacterium]